MPLKRPDFTGLRSTLKYLRMGVDWWLRTLEDCIPGRVVRVFAKRHARTSLYVDRTRVLVGVAPGEWMSAEALVAAMDPRQIVKSDADISLSDDVVLFKSITVPKAVHGDLEKAIQYQAKQHIPLAESSVVTGHILNQIPDGNDDLSITIAAVRNDTIRRALEAARLLGCVPAKFSTTSGDVTLKVNDVDQLQRVRRLTGLVLVGFLIAQIMALPLLDIQRVRNANQVLKEELNALVGKTKVAADLKQTLDRRIGDSVVLNTHLSQDNFAKGLTLLTSYTPADVWVSDLQFDGRMFRITGNAKDAAGWALKLQQQSEFENVRLENVSSSSGDAEMGRFQMTLYIKAEAEGAK